MPNLLSRLSELKKGASNHLLPSEAARLSPGGTGGGPALGNATPPGSRTPRAHGKPARFPLGLQLSTSKATPQVRPRPSPGPCRAPGSPLARGARSGGRAPRAGQGTKPSGRSGSQAPAGGAAPAAQPPRPTERARAPAGAHNGGPRRRASGPARGPRPGRRLTWRCRPRKTTAKAPCPTRSLLLYSKSPTTSMTAPPGHTAGEGAAQRAGISTAGPPARSAPAGRQTGAAAAPGPGGRSCREAGAETGEAAARGRGQRGLTGPRPLFMARPPPAAGSLAKRPRRCRARGAVAVTVRARSRTRARQRCGTRPSPSPARPAASALSAEGAAATATTALGPARPSAPRYRDTTARHSATSAGRSRADCRPSPTSVLLVGRSAQRAALPPPEKRVHAPLGARRPPPGRVPSLPEAEKEGARRGGPS